MATTIWAGLNANLIRFDVSYDAWRPDPYGDQVNITFHLHTYKRSSSVRFNYDIIWSAMWCMGNNWSGGQQIKANNVPMSEYWNDCSATVYTSNDYVAGVRFIAGSVYNDGSSGKYDTGTDINISVPAKQINRIWNDINAYRPDRNTQNALLFDLRTSDGSSWTNLTNEPADFTKTIGTVATISNIRSNLTGAHYSGNNVTNNTAASFSWTFNTANWVCELFTEWNVRNMTIRRGKGIADITSPAWAWSGTNDKKGTATFGTSFTINAALRTGYHWGNWSGTISTTNQKHTFTIEDKDYDITANGIANTYTINYISNGGTGTMVSSTHTYDTEKALSANTYKKSGYKFLGWATESSATEVVYTDKQAVKNLTSVDKGVVSLYAVWEKLYTEVKVKVNNTWKTCVIKYKEDNTSIIDKKLYITK